MKKVLKIILIIFIVVILLIVSGCSVLIGTLNHKNDNYYKYATPQGDIEKTYAPLGSYDVSYTEYDAENDVYKQFEVWYPSEMKDSESTYPLVIMANGTGITASKYKAVFEHLASWGFIVVGNEDENSCMGNSSSASLDFMIKLNSDPSSEFYSKIDIENIGIAGHSQGGVGAINAVTEQENGSLYKAVFTASTTSRYHADELNKSLSGWSCDLTKMNIPIFMVAGTGFMDAGNIFDYNNGILTEGKAQGICPLWWLNECYNAVPNSVDKVIARMVNKDHGDMLRSADAYMTAWFIYYLQGDVKAGEAFFGEDAEILSNTNWQDVQLNH